VKSNSPYSKLLASCVLLCHVSQGSLCLYQFSIRVPSAEPAAAWRSSMPAQAYHRTQLTEDSLLSASEMHLLCVKLTVQLHSPTTHAGSRPQSQQPHGAHQRLCRRGTTRRLHESWARVACAAPGSCASPSASAGCPCRMSAPHLHRDIPVFLHISEHHSAINV